MGSEFLVGTLPSTEAVEENSTAFYFNKFSMSDVFEEHFSYYLVAGMSYKEYWECDCRLVISYRKAEQMRKEKENYNMWLQGLYIYETLLNVSPILRAFAPSGTKPMPYREKPYPINENQRKLEEEEKNKAFVQKGLDYMKALMNKEEVKNE